MLPSQSLPPTAPTRRNSRRCGFTPAVCTVGRRALSPAHSVRRTPASTTPNVGIHATVHTTVGSSSGKALYRSRLYTNGRCAPRIPPSALHRWRGGSVRSHRRQPGSSRRLSPTSPATAARNAVVPSGIGVALRGMPETKLCGISVLQTRHARTTSPKFTWSRSAALPLRQPISSSPSLPT